MAGSASRQDAARGIQRLTRDVDGIPAIAFRLPDGRAHTLVPAPDGIRCAPGDDAPTVVELDMAAWRDFATEMATAAGLHYGGRLRIACGDHGALERWEPALRALFCGRRIFDPVTSCAALGVAMLRCCR